MEPSIGESIDITWPTRQIYIVPSPFDMLTVPVRTTQQTTQSVLVLRTFLEKKN
jgi:hypothetical protein